MRRALSAALTVLGSVTPLLAATPAWAASEQPSFIVTERTVVAGSRLTAYGWDCPDRANVRLQLDNRPIQEVLADNDGRFAAHLMIGARTAPGKHRLRARCGGRLLPKVAIFVVRSGISVNPRLVMPGAPVTVVGDDCPQGSKVSIRLDGTRAKTVLVGSSGRFSSTLIVPADAQRGRSLFLTAQCGSRFTGGAFIRVMKPFPLYERDLILTSRTAVPAGQAFTMTFEDCPDQAPIALLDGKPMALTLNRTGPDHGFIAKAVIPRQIVPGRYQLSAGCDVNGLGRTEIHVLDPTQRETAAQFAFGLQTSSALIAWSGALAGVALLVASVGINWRRRG
jgi:hypothetical protein